MSTDTGEQSIEQTLRPSTLHQYIGQEDLKQDCRYILRRQNNVQNHWIICYYMDHQD